MGSEPEASRRVTSRGSSPPSSRAGPARGARRLLAALDRRLPPARQAHLHPLRRRRVARRRAGRCASGSCGRSRPSPTCSPRCARATTRSARAARSADDALGLALLEVNALSETLRSQRLRALEATALLRRVMEEIDVAVFAFDGERRLRLVNRGRRAAAQPARRATAGPAGRGARPGAVPRRRVARARWTPPFRARRAAGRSAAAPSGRTGCRISSWCSPT